jgi:hypothetical protein
MNFKIIYVFIVLTCLITNCGPEEWINITVSKGLYPTYSWDKGSTYRIWVSEPGRSHKIVWAIYTPNTNGIRSPVQHGKIPERAQLFMEPNVLGPIDTISYDSSLINGKQYTVHIWKTGKYSFGTKSFIADSIK